MWAAICVRPADCCFVVWKEVEHGHKSKRISWDGTDSRTDELVEGINTGEKHQVLLGATGTGKTFTIANVIKQTGKQTLVLAHNKTLAGQLYSELKELFPNNHVCYFVSYYDYSKKLCYLVHLIPFNP